MLVCFPHGDVYNAKNYRAKYDSKSSCWFIFLTGMYIMYLNYRQDMIVILVLGFFFFFTGMYIMHLKLQAKCQFQVELFWMQFVHSCDSYTNGLLLRLWRNFLICGSPCVLCVFSIIHRKSLCSIL